MASVPLSPLSEEMTSVLPSHWFQAPDESRRILVPDSVDHHHWGL